MKFGAKEILTIGLAAFCLCRSADAFSVLRVSPVTGQATDQPNTHDTPEELGEQNSWFPTTTGPGQFGYDECRSYDEYYDECNTCVCNSRGRWICTARDCDSPGPTDKQEAGGDVATFEELGIRTTPETQPIQTTQAIGAEPASEETGVSGSPVPESTDENLPTEAPGLFARVTPIPASEMCKTNEDNMKTYFDGCNTCRCFDIGQSVCTKKACPVINLVTSRPSTYPTTATPEVEQSETHDTPEELGLQDWFPTSAAPEPVQPRTHDTLEELGMQTTFKTETTAVPGQFVRVTPIPASEMCKTNEDTMKTYFDGCNTCRCFDIGQSVCTKKACPVILVTSRLSTQPTTAAPEVEQPNTHDTPEELGIQDWFTTTAAPDHVQPRTHDTTEELGIRTTLRPETQPTTVTSESGEEPETTAISETSEQDEVSQSEEQAEQEGESEGISESPDDAHTVSQSEEQAEPLGDSVMMNDEHIEESPIPEARDDNLSASGSGRFVRVKPIPASVACKKNEDIFKMYFNGCNMCRCYDIGQSFCQRKACPVIPVRQQQPSNLPSDLCRAATDIGKQFKDRCNSCWCRNIGHALCTRRDCPNNQQR